MSAIRCACYVRVYTASKSRQRDTATFLVFCTSPESQNATSGIGSGDRENQRKAQEQFSAQILDTAKAPLISSRPTAFTNHPKSDIRNPTSLFPPRSRPCPIPAAAPRPPTSPPSNRVQTPPILPHTQPPPQLPRSDASAPSGCSAAPPRPARSCIASCALAPPARRTRENRSSAGHRRSTPAAC